MSLFCCAHDVFATYKRILSSIQLRVNKNFFHQSSFYLSNFVHKCWWVIGQGYWLGVIGLLPIRTKIQLLFRQCITFINSNFHLNRELYYALIVLVLLYGSKRWCLRKEDERRLLVAEKSLGLRRIIGRSRR